MMGIVNHPKRKIMTVLGFNKSKRDEIMFPEMVNIGSVHIAVIPHWVYHNRHLITVILMEHALQPVFIFWLIVFWTDPPQYLQLCVICPLANVVPVVVGIK